MQLTSLVTVAPSATEVETSTDPRNEIVRGEVLMIDGQYCRIDTRHYNSKKIQRFWTPTMRQKAGNFLVLLYVCVFRGS